MTPVPLPGAESNSHARKAVRTKLPARVEAPSVYFAGPENSLVAAAISKFIAAAGHSATRPAPSVSVSVAGATGPLTLIGPPGCGKSLLAAGVAAAWTEAVGEDAVLAISGVDLRRQLERSIAGERNLPGCVADLADRLASLRLLVLEDLDGLAESPTTVEFLSATLDQLAAAGAATLVTAGKPLGEIPGLDARVVGRLAEGLTLEVAAPAEAARHELLVASLAATGCQIEPSAAAELASWLSADARRVLAAADQLRNRFGVRKRISRSDARVFVNDAALDQASTPLSEIVSVVARYYAMPLRTVRSSSRKAPVVLARAVAIYLARQLTPLSYEEIGRYLGGRDHTTVMHNYNRINDNVPTDRALRSAIDDLLRKLGRADLTASPTDRSGEAS